jgi:TRAP-type C4-dicarboxylate transport system permease small subunit
MAYVLFVIPLGFFLLVLQFLRDFLAGLRTLKDAGSAGAPGAESEKTKSDGGGH